MLSISTEEGYVQIKGAIYKALTYKTVPRGCYKSYVSWLDRAVLEMNQPGLIEMAVKITAKLAVKNRFWQTPLPATELQSPRGSAATLC